MRPDPDQPRFPDHHGEDVAEAEDAAEELAWRLDNVELVTVGLDIGSSTSHLLLSRLHLQRLAQSLSSRFVVVERETLHRSPIRLTPFRPGGLIDAAALRGLLEEGYRQAGIGPGDVDTGAVILTGVALERANARPVAELFAAEGGKFVCASAGHNMEAILAAHGSGAVALARGSGRPGLHLDVGGGTTKLALLEGGEVRRTAAVAAGGRLLVLDAHGRVERVEGAGLGVEVGDRLTGPARRRLADELAAAVLDAAAGGSAGGRLLTPPLEVAEPLERLRVTVSGGVSEYLFGRESRTFGDIAPELAAALRARFEAAGVRPEPAREGIRATVIGASQFTVQVSGSTVHLRTEERLPLHNLPVVRPRLAPRAPLAGRVAAAIGEAFARLDLGEGDAPVALALAWQGEPRYEALRELAGGVAAGLRRTLERGLPVVLAVDADVGLSLGAILTEEFAAGPGLLVLDGLDLEELDYVDVGRVLRPAGVVPVVVKSLAFSAPYAPAPPGRRSRTGGRA